MAEMSGRKRRMVKQPNGSYKYCLRSSGDVPLEKVYQLYLMMGLSRSSMCLLWILAHCICFCDASCAHKQAKMDPAFHPNVIITAMLLDTVVVLLLWN